MIHIVHVRDVIGVQRAGSTVVRDILSNRAHTDLPSGNGVTLWVPETLRTSCDLLILVNQPAEPGV